MPLLKTPDASMKVVEADTQRARMAEASRKKAGASNRDQRFFGNWKTTSVPVKDEKPLLDGDNPDAMGKPSDNLDGYEEDTL